MKRRRGRRSKQLLDDLVEIIGRGIVRTYSVERSL